MRRREIVATAGAALALPVVARAQAPAPPVVGFFRTTGAGGYDDIVRAFRAGLAEKNVPACASCHGPTGTGIPAQYPLLGGQFAEYIEAQLRAFRSGERANDPNRMMRTTAARLSDAEIRAVANYIAGLR